jgi:hypothetical protein
MSPYGPIRTSSNVRNSVAIGGKPDMTQTAQFGIRARSKALMTFIRKPLPIAFRIGAG